MKVSDDVYKIKGNGSVYVILGAKVVVIDTGDIMDRSYMKKEIELKTA